MRILGIETSCDETAVSVVEDARIVHANTIASVSDLFHGTGGVIPEDAARKQLQLILPSIHACLRDAGMTIDGIDAIAVTRGPGLLGSLLVGTIAARTFAYLHHKPLIGVHHTLGHLCSVWPELPQEEEIKFPILTLSASGGHTDLWLRHSPMRGALLGRTQDDAAGEAFDKGAQLLGLPYPGGPSIAKAAMSGNDGAFSFPLPLHKEDTCNFSFSGLKNALRVTIASCDHPLPVADLAASYQRAICLHLIDKVRLALKRHPEAREVHLVGGVSANLALRAMMKEHIDGRMLRHPATLRHCTDNAAMIAAAADLWLQENKDRALAPFQTKATIRLEEAMLF